MTPEAMLFWEIRLCVSAQEISFRRKEYGICPMI